MLHKPAKTQVPIHELIAQRWSPRAFDRDRPINRAQLIALLEAARWAPSCFGDEPWHYVVWDRHKDESAWKKAFDCLAESNQAWVKNAPLLMLSTANPTFHHNGKPNRWGSHDTGAASENICLQAAALGLAAHQMGGFDADKIRQAFDIPASVECIAMIAVGYATEAHVLEGDMKAKELAERVRRPLSENFFEGGWEVPINLAD